MRRSTPESFWAKVDKNSAAALPGIDRCWLWIGHKNAMGYGTVTYQRRLLLAHRLAWELTQPDPIPKGMCGCHKCDNPACVRPSHIFIGTHADNRNDAKVKGRLRALAGELVWQAKLRTADIQEIFSLRDAGMRTTALAERFGVDTVTIQKVLARSTWKHVEVRRAKVPVVVERMVFFGESNVAAKLTADDVREIRRLCAEGSTRHVDIGKMFGVNDRSVSNIHLRHTWRHVE